MASCIRTRHPLIEQILSPSKAGRPRSPATERTGTLRRKYCSFFFFFNKSLFTRGKLEPSPFGIPLLISPSVPNSRPSLCKCRESRLEQLTSFLPTGDPLSTFPLLRPLSYLSSLRARDFCSETRFLPRDSFPRSELGKTSCRKNSFFLVGHLGSS